MYFREFSPFSSPLADCSLRVLYADRLHQVICNSSPSRPFEFGLQSGKYVDQTKNQQNKTKQKNKTKIEEKSRKVVVLRPRSHGNMTPQTPLFLMIFVQSQSGINWRSKYHITQESHQLQLHSTGKPLRFSFSFFFSQFSYNDNKKKEEGKKMAAKNQFLLNIDLVSLSLSLSLSTRSCRFGMGKVLHVLSNSITTSWWILGPSRWDGMGWNGTGGRGWREGGLVASAFFLVFISREETQKGKKHQKEDGAERRDRKTIFKQKNYSFIYMTKKNILNIGKNILVEVHSASRLNNSWLCRANQAE